MDFGNRGVGQGTERRSREQSFRGKPEMGNPGRPNREKSGFGGNANRIKAKWIARSRRAKQREARLVGKARKRQP
jgi:hypothetical protein